MRREPSEASGLLGLLVACIRQLKAPAATSRCAAPVGYSLFESAKEARNNKLYNCGAGFILLAGFNGILAIEQPIPKRRR